MDKKLGIILSIFAIVGGIYAFFKWGIAGLRKLLHPSQVLLDIPKKTIVILPTEHLNTAIWTPGKVLDKPAMMISARLRVTNITRGEVQLTATRLKKPKAFGFVSVEDDKGLGRVIASGATADAVVIFTVVPPIKEKGEPVHTEVALIDQFGNEHWTKKVNFQSAG